MVNGGGKQVRKKGLNCTENKRSFVFTLLGSPDCWLGRVRSLIKAVVDTIGVQKRDVFFD